MALTLTQKFIGSFALKCPIKASGPRLGVIKPFWVGFGFQSHKFPPPLPTFPLPFPGTNSSGISAARKNPGMPHTQVRPGWRRRVRIIRRVWGWGMPNRPSGEVIRHPPAPIPSGVSMDLPLGSGTWRGHGGHDGNEPADDAGGAGGSTRSRVGGAGAGGSGSAGARIMEVGRGRERRRGGGFFPILLTKAERDLPAGNRSLTNSTLKFPSSRSN